ncbi:MAG: hypothetical protein ACJ8EY_03735 [Sphingomicrobium sp.]
MRSIPLLILGSAVAACSSSPQPGAYEAANNAKLQAALAGKVAGRPVACLPSHRSEDLIRVGDEVAVFRDGPNRVYVSQLNGRCTGLGDSGNALITKTIGANSVCHGDFARVVDLTSRITVGACSFGDFVPYTKAGA